MAHNYSSRIIQNNKAFTLIELLVVIAIIAILAVVVVLTLNPAELLRQSRDANRVSDMATLNAAINLYNTDQAGASGYSLGLATTSYLSLPSSASNCSTLGMATSGYPYACSTSANYRNASSSGWIPINFQNISSGSPFSSLPVDPVNQTSSNLYYAYETNGNQYILSSFMESQKYAKNMQSTGGIDPALYEVGSGATSLPDASRGLVGYWPLSEGGTGPAIDWSGNQNNGTWSGTQAGTNGYYSPGKTSQWAGTFDGSSTYVNIVTPIGMPTGSIATVSAWIKPAGYSDTSYNGVLSWGSRTCSGTSFLASMQNSGRPSFASWCNDFVPYSGTAAVLNTWNFVAWVLNGSSITLYLNGVVVSSGTVTPLNIAAGALNIGSTDNPGRLFQGLITDVRVYNRALSASEVQEIYNAEE